MKFIFIMYYKIKIIILNNCIPLKAIKFHCENLRTNGKSFNLEINFLKYFYLTAFIII